MADGKRDRNLLSTWALWSIALSALLSPAIEVQAQTKASRVALNYPGLKLYYTLPKGFCQPTGAYSGIAKTAFAGDREQLLLIAAFRCETMAAGKPPTEVLSIVASRPDINTDVGDRASFLREGKIPDGGRDAFGQYTSVESTARVGKSVVYRVHSGAMTAINRRMVILNYSNASLTKTPMRQSALEFIKAQTRSLVQENEAAAKR